MDARRAHLIDLVAIFLLFCAFGCGSGFENPPDPPTVDTQAASQIDLTSGTLNGGVNPNGGNTTAWFEWGTDLGYGHSTGAQAVGSGKNIIAVNQRLQNLLAPNQTYFYRLVAANESGTVYGAGMNFATPAPQAPVATTNGPSVITQTGCSFNGTVNPNGAATTGWFEWGPDASYGTTTTVQPLGNGTTDVALSQPLTGLSPDTAYHYRAAAENAAGTAFGQDEVCTTLAVTTNPPVVTTEPATGITPTAVTLNGTIDPHGLDAFGRFEWGVTTAYGNVTAEQYMGNGSTAVPLSLRLTGLSPKTLYHYRAIGRGDGEATGQDQSFTTPTASVPSRLFLSNDASGSSDDRIVVIDPNPTIHNDVTNTDDPNPNYNKQIGNVTVTGQDPAELAAHPNGTEAYVMVGKNLSVLSINPTSPFTTIEFTSLTAVGDLFNHLVVSPDGKKLYLAYRKSSSPSTLQVKIFDLTDPTNPTLTTTISDPLFDGCYGPLGLGISPDGNLLYLPCTLASSSSLPDHFYLVDTTTNTVTQTATFPATRNNDAINAIAVKPDGSAVYLARRNNVTDNNTVEIFDGATGANVGSIPLPSNALASAGVVSPDGSKLYVVDDRFGIDVIDTGSNTLLLTMPPTTSRGLDIAITPDGARLYTSLLFEVLVNATATNSWVTTITGDFSSSYQLTITPGHP